MKNYLEMARYVLDNGESRPDRTGTGTKGVFGYQTRFDLSEGFPLLTTKKTHFASLAKELIWFISGDTNIQPLVKAKVRIWNEWPYQSFQKSEDYNGETMKEFNDKLDRIIEKWARGRKA